MTTSPQSPLGSAGEFRTQWAEPVDIFSLLLLVGGDTITSALAAISGSLLTPVSFSFGWVSYAISSLLTAEGENRVMPSSSETPLLLFNLESAYRRLNRSWVLGRVFRDYEHWMSEEVRSRVEKPEPLQAADESGNPLQPADANERQALAKPVSLCVAVYKWKEGAVPAKPGYDWVWVTGLLVTSVQLGISAIPFGLHGDWGVFLITLCGSFLAYASGALPQWAKEKWACRRKKKDVALTLGNGSRHVIVILGSDQGLDLEDLAGGQVLEFTGTAPSGTHRWIRQVLPRKAATRLLPFILTLLWLLLLVTSTGIRTHSWYLLAVGTLGMIQNLVAAGAPRQPAALGLPIELATESGPGDAQQPAVPVVFAEPKVMWSLMELELKHPGFGRALLNEFFPGDLRPWEKDWWAASAEPAESAESADNIAAGRRLLLQQNKRKMFEKWRLEATKPTTGTAPSPSTHPPKVMQVGSKEQKTSS